MMAQPSARGGSVSRAFRHDIQGLRAVAVTAVVLFHLWPGKLPGGYVGVDVFFVISGFLITQHLLADVEAAGSVRLLPFWSRRVRRLLPAAITVLVACIFFAIFVLDAASSRNLREIIASALYVENWFLAANSVDYLGAENSASLVQHFWSLSVEEQFYIVWPVAIGLAMLLVRRRKTSARRVIFVLLALIFVVSLSASIVTTMNDPSRAYFVTQARAWEFAAGGLCVFFAPYLARINGPRPTLFAAFGWAGLAMIACAVFFYDASTSFPGFAAGLPVFGSATLILANEHRPRWSFGAVSGARWVSAIGDLSYGIYLWHWPLIVVAPYLLHNPPQAWQKALILVLTLALAGAMKRYIEDPARYSRRVRSAPRGSLAVYLSASVVTALIAGVCLVVVRPTGVPDEVRASPCYGAKALLNADRCTQPFARTATVDPAYAATNTYWSEGSVQADGNCRPQGDIPASCELGETVDPSRTIAFIGNSHAEAMLDPMASAAHELGWRLLPAVRARCSGMSAPEELAGEIAANPSLADDLNECARWSKNMFERILANNSISVVVVAARGVQDSAYLRDRVAQMEKAGKRVIWLGDSPDMPEGEAAPECVETSSAEYDPCSFSKPDLAEQTNLAADLGVPYIDMTPNFCSEDTCHVVVGGLITYFDNNHLTLSYAQSLSPYVRDKLDQIVNG